MDESICLRCGEAGSSEKFTVDRLGVYHWFRHCAHCGHRWGTQHKDPAHDNPYTRMKTNSWRPDPTPPPRF